MTFRSESAHDRHDPLLVAAHASHDLAPAEAGRVEQWLRDCRVCASLHADVASISGALATLPRTASAPRDFRLTPAQAERLRGGPWWRRFGRAITAPKGVGRPLATAFTTLGLVGLLIGNLPAAMLMTAGGAAPETSLDTVGASQDAPLPAAAPSPGNTDAAAVPEDGRYEGRTNALSGSGTSPSPMNDEVTTTDRPVTENPAPTSVGAPLAGDDLTSGRDAPAPNSPVVPLAIAFLAIGLGLFAVRRLGDRFA